MNVSISLYLLVDSHGNKAYAVCEDGSNTVQICGLKDENGENVTFESEAYHISTFAKNYKIDVQKIEYSNSFDILYNNSILT